MEWGRACSLLSKTFSNKLNPTAPDTIWVIGMKSMTALDMTAVLLSKLKHRTQLSGHRGRPKNSQLHIVWRQMFCPAAHPKALKLTHINKSVKKIDVRNI